MVDIYFDKLYRYDRPGEPCSIAIPVKEGELFDVDKVAVLQEGNPLPVQTKVTSRHKDGSVRYMFVRFKADLPANKGAVLQCDFNSGLKNNEPGVMVEEIENGLYVDTGALKFSLKNNSGSIFGILNDNNKTYSDKNFAGPFLKEKNGVLYDCAIGEWSVVEAGDVCAVMKADGRNVTKSKTDSIHIDFELRVTAYAGKPWVEISYRIINTSMTELDIGSLIFYIKASENTFVSSHLSDMDIKEENDSTGCGDKPLDNSGNEGPVFHTRGIGELEMLQEKSPVKNVRTMAGSSNYKTDFLIGRNGAEVNKYVDATMLIKEANEHFAEVFYGTFMADRTDEEGGVCVTVFQAQQNYPKAVKADMDGIALMLVPEDKGSVIMQPGMAREQRFLLHFHAPDETLKELDNRSLIYQMPDRPYISPEVFKNSGVMLDVFPEILNDDVEIALMAKADGHSRCYGMLNWGDSYDPGYTEQGRGNGKPVWCNNEYDYPHSCALLYARTGVRRYLDYLFVSAQHWMDVDVCHYSDDPLKLGGQWEHTAGHCKNGVMVCSHEWVEGLLDYYHFSGDERAYDTAIGIGDNVLRLLDTPMYAKAGEANARETGWALRTLTALYVETRDEKWLVKSEWIIDSFKVWEEEYGNWLAPYTDNTAVRVGFMISVAIGSVMRYYREFPREDIKEMIIRAVDDLIDNCMLGNGLFYYKELPSLQRLGNNTLLLESLAIAYELTGDEKYLKPGIKTFKMVIGQSWPKVVGKKEVVDDVVIGVGGSTKGFAQSFIPLITYYKAISDKNML